jgi:ribosomal protein S18 acetylase RimI-like enzyme
VPGPAQLRELSRSEFLTELETLLAIYAAAMQPESAYLSGRLAIMERHAGHPGFAAIVALAPSDRTPPAIGSAAQARGAGGLVAGPPGADMPGAGTAGAGRPGSPLDVAGAAGSRIAAFAYGFRGATGQWWHDVVAAGVTAASGPDAATRWLADAMEIAEVHVRPEYQQQGIGRRLLRALTAARTERTAVLSTQASNSPARRLYRSMGFTDLLATFNFPGGGPPYAVMGAPLPLVDQRQEK